MKSRDEVSFLNGIYQSKGLKDKGLVIISINYEKSSVKPLITVIIPVFNAEAYIRKCLDSVTGATLKDIEIICVDDGSTDGSLTILKEYESKDARVKVLAQEHQYCGAARNYGLAIAQGEYVHFIDADDWIDTEAYEKWYQLAKESHADICACMHYNVNVQTDKIFPAGDVIYRKRQDRYLQITNFNEDAEYLIYGVVVSWNKIYLRRFLVDNNIRFDNLICAEDRSFYFEVIYKAKRVAVVREYWLYHRINNKSSLDGSDIRLKNFEVQFHSFEEIWKIVKDDTEKVKKKVLNACIGSSFYYYRKSIGTVYEETIKEKLYRYWSSHIHLLGDELFKADWLPHYLKLIKDHPNEIRKIEIKPADSLWKAKTFVFSFDEKYVKYFSVALLSLITHASQKNRYEIIVLYDRLSNEKQKMLQNLLPENFTIRFICVSVYANEIFGDLKAKVSSKQWDVSTFYDMLVPLLMPGYERVLYCDSDIVFNRNPDEFFDMPFDDKKLIAIQDTLQTALAKYPEKSFLQKQKNFLNHDVGIDNFQEYFNGGVLLFNTKAILREEYLDRALKALSFPVLPTVDQDALNYVFKGNVKIIPQRFNFQYHLLDQFSETEFKNEVASQYLSEGQNPVIVHYTTPVKPWDKPYCALGYMFWKYAKLSPFYEEIIYENVQKKQELLVQQKLKLLKAELLKDEEEYAKYKTVRIDIKNFGTADNNVTIERCSDEAMKMNSPDWFKNVQGTGVVLHSAQGNIELEAKCVGAGNLRLWLRGKDCRNSDEKRYPVWICVTCLRVDGNELFNSPHLVWHDKPFVYNMNVTDGQVVKIYMEWQNAVDVLAKEREVNIKRVDEMQQEISRLGKSEAETGKKLREIQQKVKQLEQAKANTEKDLKMAQTDVKCLKQVKAKTEEQLKESQKEARKIKREYKNVKNGWSFKIGRIITYVPRKIKDSLKK